MKNQIEQDLKLNWHPCMQMKDFEETLPIMVASAKGNYVYDTTGKSYIDANSSWWCKNLGHGEPRLTEALIKQAQQFTQTIYANTTYDGIIELSHRLTQYIPHTQRVLYASEGSMAVEIALKMALHAQQLRGEEQRTQFCYLENAYHGETALALGVSDLGLYKDPYKALFQQYPILKNLTYIHGQQDSNWTAPALNWERLEAQLDKQADSLCAIILEPLLQGAGGMLIYQPDLLTKLGPWARKNKVYIIADEIFTGFGRTGKTFGAEHGELKPDFSCLGKGLTAGEAPLSAVCTTEEIYQLFYADYKDGKAFMHSNTYSGNALGVHVALATLDVYEQDGLLSIGHMAKLQNNIKQAFNTVIDQTGLLNNFRSIGTMVAADLITPEDTKNTTRWGFEVYKTALKYGALLRPLGNTIYWLLPLNTTKKTIQELAEITIQSIKDNLSH